MALRRREAAHPCLRLLPRIGLKAGWALKRRRPPTAHRGVPGLPRGLWSQTLSSCGHHWHSPTGASCPILCLRVRPPPCLTTSLAPVGSFLEMTWSRAGDCGQEAGWEGSAGEPDRREKGQAGGAGSGGGGEHADARCVVPRAGSDVAASRW